MVLGGYTLGDSSPSLSFSASMLEFRAPYIDAPVVLNLAPPKTYESAYKHRRIHARARKYPLPKYQLKRSSPTLSTLKLLLDSRLSLDESKKSGEVAA